jgi:hypothetical protein
MTAPIYFDCEKNKTIEVYTCQSVTIRDIIQRYPTGYRGGTHDPNGRVAYRRGGSTEAENASRYRQETAARGADTRLQVRGCLASQAGRSGEVYRGSEVYQEEELISVSSVTTQRTAITIGTRLTERCRLSLLHAYSATCGKNWQGVARRDSL